MPKFLKFQTHLFATSSYVCTIHNMLISHQVIIHFCKFFNNSPEMREVIFKNVWLPYEGS